jgi:trans-aconitate 2-methyltransferase
MSWDPGQYLKFAGPRLRPAVDLLARVSLAAETRNDPPPASPAGRGLRIADLGCGAGNVTRLLVRRWPLARIDGIDDSAAMLDRARGGLRDVRWIDSSIADWRAEAEYDLVFTNAALHWLPGHATLLPRLARALRRDGVLAVQMPRNFEAPSHTAIADTVRAGAWRERLEPLLAPPPVAAPDLYFDWLAPLASSLDIWEAEYLQVLHGPDPVKEWTKGTWLRQFLDRLEPGEREAFENDYAARVRVAYPQRADGSTLFPFRRLFIVMTVR